MHTDFLRAIITNPDDDAPRLIYADWLDENAGDVACGRCFPGNGCPLCLQHGHLKGHETCYTCDLCFGTERVSNGLAERAEFIRVQCELAHERFANHPDPHDPVVWRFKSRSPCKKCVERDGLRRRERELLTDNHFEWMGRPEGLATYRHPDGDHKWLVKKSGEGSSQIDIEFRRGFIESITCTWNDCRDHLNAILAEHPVTEVTLTTAPTQADGTAEKFMWLETNHKGLMELPIGLHHPRWPRIKTWNLPVPQYNDTYSSHLRRMFSPTVIARLDG